MRGTPNGINERRLRIPAHELRSIRLLNAGRIIPAHAGNSWSVDTAPERRPDHPRACGELPDEPAIDRRDLGSSPRMRGTRYFRNDTNTVVRIIPAHAGNSYPPQICSQKSSDHPRACGELLMLDRATLSPIGSSPRMRGTLPSMEVVLTMKRIIPAHAGNSHLSQLNRPIDWDSDHPRACGELTVLTHALDGAPFGSSPRMRGTHSLLANESGHNAHDLGSSPRMRGTLSLDAP